MKEGNVDSRQFQKIIHNKTQLLSNNVTLYFFPNNKTLPEENVNRIAKKEIVCIKFFMLW